MPPSARQELAVAHPVGAGVRAPHAAEKLALDQLLRDRRAVDLHQGFAAARALVVDRVSDEFLAVPFSPDTSTEASVATIRTCSFSSAIGGLSPVMR